MTRKTNVETIVDLMEISDHGALVQAFVIQGLLTYCDMIASVPPETLTNGLIDGSKWQAIAAEVKGKLDERYAPAKKDESTLVFTTAKGAEENRISVAEFTETKLTRGFSPDEGKAFWGTTESISNRDAFQEKPTWATCIYFFPAKKG